MKRNLNAACAALLLTVCGLFATGCNDETQADPALVESMNKQREAMRPDAAPQPPSK